MLAIVIAVVIVIALASALVYVFAMSAKSAGEGASEAVDRKKKAAGTGLPKPEVIDFHVAGDTAKTYFGVPLGDSDAGQHLVDLLSLSAVEYLHQKQRAGLPLGGVEKIAVYAKRSGESVLVTTVELPETGELPDPAHMRVFEATTTDPVAELTAVVADATVGSPPSASGDIEPVASFVDLTGPTDASLRAMGVDPSSMSLDDLARGLFTIGGYQVDSGAAGVSVDSPSATTFGATKAGSRVSVVVVPHEDGSHPEVDEKVFTSIGVAAGQMNVDQIMLISDKFGPYSMYEREKRSSKTVFITRERLQAFVDSFGLG